MSGLRTLGEFIVEKQADFPHASGDLSSLLASIRLAAKIVNREINAAGLGDITGAVGTENVQGEDQQKLDVLLDAYAQVRPLNTLERACWPRFLELAALRFWVSRLSTLYLPGYQQQVKQGVSIKPPDEMKRILQAAMGRD